MSFATREVESIVAGRPASDGAGVKLTRVLTDALHRRLDPFLMLDAFGSENPGDYLAGFPNHPHRGFETVTYMLAGRMRHRDNAGNEGLLEAGGAQWMTAGRGIIHSEMPEQEDGLMEGFQLWLNLPANAKMCEPGYRDLNAADIPELVTEEGVRLRVIAGHANGTTGAIQREITEPIFIDAHLPAGSRCELQLPAAHNAFVHVYRGALRIGAREREVPAACMAVLETSAGTDGVRLLADAADARAIVVAGAPLREPIVQYGPFVMNTREQIMQAIDDYQRGRFGAPSAV